MKLKQMLGINSVRCADLEAAPRMEALILHLKEMANQLGVLLKQ